MHKTRPDEGTIRVYAWRVLGRQTCTYIHRYIALVPIYLVCGMSSGLVWDRTDAVIRFGRVCCGQPGRHFAWLMVAMSVGTTVSWYRASRGHEGVH